MKTIEILHNPRCSKSRVALALLEEKELNPQVRLYLKDPLSVKELKKLAKLLGLRPKQFVREGEFGKLELTMASTDEDLFEQIAANPILLERPIVVVNDQAMIGRPTEAILDIL